MNLRLRPPGFAFLLMALLTASCSQELEQAEPPSTSVAGRVLISGTPAGRGWIEFQPVEGSRGLLRSAPVGADGSFQATRLPVGPLAIRFLPASPPLRTGDPRLDYAVARLEQAYAIRRAVSANSNEPLLIDLAEEAARLARKAP